MPIILALINSIIIITISVKLSLWCRYPTLLHRCCVVQWSSNVNSILHVKSLSALIRTPVSDLSSGASAGKGNDDIDYVM